MAFQVQFHPEHSHIIHAQFLGVLSTQDFVKASEAIATLLKDHDGHAPFGLIVDFSEAEDFSENLKVGDLRNAAFNLPTSIQARVAISPPLMAWLVIGILNRVTRSGTVALADDLPQAIIALNRSIGQLSQH